MALNSLSSLAVENKGADPFNLYLKGPSSILPVGHGMQYVSLSNL